MEEIEDFVYSAINLARDGMVPDIWVDSQYLQSDSSISDGAEMLRARLWIDEEPWEEGVEPITRRLTEFTGIRPTFVSLVGQLITFYWLDDDAIDMADKFNLKKPTKTKY